MGEFLHSVVVQEQSLSASAVTDLIDLPVNPISHIVLNVEALNDTGTLTDYDSILGLLAFISKLEVLFKGQAVVEGSLVDLAILYQTLLKMRYGQVNKVATNNARRSLSMIIPFGRKLYMGAECFPATSRGEFQVRLTTTTAQTGLDGVTFNLEAVELLNETPKHFIKSTSFTGTQSSTGEHDVDLPRGNPILGCLLFATTVGQADETGNTIRDLRLLVDNQERYFSKTNWNALSPLIATRLPTESPVDGHTHQTDIADATGTFRSSTEAERVASGSENYAYLDFDPQMDGSMQLETAGRGRVHMRITYGDTNAMRYLPVEQIEIS